MENLLQDLRLGLRMLRKHWGISAVAVTTITLGIALTTMVFSFVNGALFKGLPAPEPDRVLVLQSTDPLRNSQRRGIWLPDLVEFMDQQSAFTGLAAVGFRTINRSNPDEQPERYEGAVVSANLFEIVLRVQPLLGRSFREGEDLAGAMRTGLIQLAIGLGIGILLAAAAASPLQWILYEVNARDPWVFGTVALAFGIVGLLASLVPARRVTRVEPVLTLATE